MTAAALGGRVQLMSSAGAAGARSTSLAVEADAVLSRFEVEDNGAQLGGVEVDTRRVRLALKGEGRFDLGGVGEVLMPSAELGMRWDGGDGETGMGLEAGGGLGYAAPGRGLRMDVGGRTLMAHAGDVEEWGLSGALRVEPGAGGRGASFALGLSWGEAGSALARLWTEGAREPGSVDSAGDNASMRVEAEGGYGLAARGGGVLTPYAGLGVGSGGEERSYRVGIRRVHGAASELGLEGSRRESGTGAPDHALTLQWRMSW